MKESLVNLNVNPCKMCMPMGAVNALYGVKNAMTILHGSQGCSTYIRRHMATHYNEPVDIASSSLTEHGTVYGGEENLKKGLENLIETYKPQLIGVATTCLAETIGEDISRIIHNFYTEHPNHKDVHIIPIPTPGYGGTQYEGYFRGIYSLLKNTTMDTDKNECINVITTLLSPADIRYLKQVLDAFEIEYILLPDISENLDGGHKDNYEKLPSTGTELSNIKKMAGARFTIEISSFLPKEYSPAQYLWEEYQVPFERLNVPVGLRDTDQLFQLLSRLAKRPVPTTYVKERSRYVDGMIDSHKYNSEGRAVIFGEPDFVYSTVRLCAENGIMPVLTATGSVIKEWEEPIKEEIETLSDRFFADKYEILDDIDFATIEKKALEYGATLMIGNSDARRIEEKHEIALVRRGFPIHDRMGGQRLRTIGYEGSMMFLDDITNTILQRKEKRFRKTVYDTFFKEEEAIAMENSKTEQQSILEEKTKTHPCYNCGAHEYARIHLPVAPKCNISCNYCLRKYDCPNESRPGVTTKVLTPTEAFERYVQVKEKVKNLTVVGIAGPGDALANFEDTKKTLEMIKEYDPKVTFCISTNGLMLPMYAHELARLGVSHVTVTLNAVDPKISANIYKYVEYMGTKYTGETAAAILLTNQLNGIKMLSDLGIMCKVNIVMLKGYNDHHIPTVVEKVKELGAVMTNIMQMIPVKGSVFEDLPQVSNKEVNEMRKACQVSLKQMYHCRQCRADAIGTLGQDISLEVNSCQSGCGTKKEPVIFKKKRFAVASKSGMLVDMHFGHAEELYIYEYRGKDPVFIEKRMISKYCTGEDNCLDGESKMPFLIKAMEDCDCVIAMRIGESPKSKLAAKGIQVYPTYDRIEDAIKKAAKEFYDMEYIAATS